VANNFEVEVMANVLVLGGGFGGLVAAEALARRLGPAHQIILVSRDWDFIFYPALVRVAFGRCAPADIHYDLRLALSSRGIAFVQAEIVSLDPDAHQVIIADGVGERRLAYDYVVFALGRRLAIDDVPGFANAHHLLTVAEALKFGKAIEGFRRGQAVIGYCPEARLAVPVYETAFALDRVLRDHGDRQRTAITIIAPGSMGELLGGETVTPGLRSALEQRSIEFVSDFRVNSVTAAEVRPERGPCLGYDLLMLIPPFKGPAATRYAAIADADGYIRVDGHLRATGADRIYAVGDAVNLPGPKMGHMAVMQGEVAAANIASEVAGRSPVAHYDHELMLVIDEGEASSIYLYKELGQEGVAEIQQGRFWTWAKQVHQRYWTRLHSLKQIEPFDE
jgi:sulfide:quinone oxidoreductase